MNCMRCGRNNPANARHCTYCGVPLLIQNNAMQNKKNSQKQSESIMVAFVIVLALLLVIVAGVFTGVFIYKNNTRQNADFGDRNGGDSRLTQNFSAKDARFDSQNTIVDVTETPGNMEEHPQTTEEITVSNERWSKKDEFQNKANAILQYSRNHLEAAENQYEINYESGIVYKKWDALLNEVYRYLKTILSENRFKQLEGDELKWIEEKENAVNKAGVEWGGGSGEIMARNMTAIQYTEERCYYLISLIN